jgi:hypothetical protein
MPSIGGWHGSGSDKPRRARVSLGILLISAGIGRAGIDGRVVFIFLVVSVNYQVADHAAIFDVIELAVISKSDLLCSATPMLIVSPWSQISTCSAVINPWTL